MQKSRATYYLTKAADPMQLSIRFFMAQRRMRCVVAWPDSMDTKVQSFDQAEIASASVVQAMRFAQEIACRLRLEMIAVEIDDDVPLRSQLIEAADIELPH